MNAFQTFLTGFASVAAISACSHIHGSENPVGGVEKEPVVSIKSFSLDGNELNMVIHSENAIATTYLVHTESYDVKEAFDDGIEIEANTDVEIKCSLDWDKSYTVYVVAASLNGEYVSETRTVSLTSESFRDLGKPANTYIISSAGYYGFKPLKVDGSMINVMSVDWLWATSDEPFAKEQKIISDVQLVDGVITFRAFGNEGSAVIVGFDAMGEVAWSWLIWCTDPPRTLQITENSYFLDRAIGATSASQEEGKKCWHMIMYQFGRISPFFSGYEDEWGNGDLFQGARQWTVVNPALAAGFQWNVSHLQQPTRAAADKEPMTFFTGNLAQKDGIWYAGKWDEDFLKGSWYGVKQETGEWVRAKTNYDPCPAGYQIPLASDWGPSNEFLEKIQPSGKDFEKVLSGEMREVNADKTDWGWYYTYKDDTSWFPCGNSNRQDISGLLIRGFTGTTMLWNASLYDLGVIQGTPGIITNMFPSRWIFLFDKTAMQGTDVSANPSFAIGVRCVKIRETEN